MGTFRPVNEEIITDHKMHSEYYRVDERAAEIINKANQDAATIRSDAQSKIADLTSQLTALRKQTSEYYDSLKKITDAQTASMEQIKRLL